MSLSALFAQSQSLTEFRINTLLDASKTGLSLRPDVLKSDEKFAGRLQRPRCFDPATASFRKQGAEFVLDALSDNANRVRDELLARFESSVATHPTRGEKVRDWDDSDLRAPYHRLVVQSHTNEVLSSDIKLLERTVWAQEKEFRRLRQVYAAEKRSVVPKKRAAVEGDNYLLPVMKQFRQHIEGLQVLHLLADEDELKASCAVAQGSEFAFAVAFRDLCHIQRRASGRRGRYSTVDEIAQGLSMGSAARRLFVRCP